MAMALSSPALKHIENITLINYAATAAACVPSENDDRFAILSLAGTYVLEIDGVRENTMLTTSFTKHLIPASKYKPRHHLGLDTVVFMSSLNKTDLTESILRQDICPEMPHLAGSSLQTHSPYPVSAAWSPSDLIGGHDSALAVRTDTGAANVYQRLFSSVGSSDYYSICNVSACVVDELKASWSTWTGRHTDSEIFEEKKRRSDEVTITALTWSHVVNVAKDDSLCLLITGHQNGCIMFWRFGTRTFDDCSVIPQLKCLGKQKIVNSRITALRWVAADSSTNRGLLFYGTLSGVMGSIPVLKFGDTLKFGTTVPCISNEDGIAVNNIEHNFYKRDLYLFVTKLCNFLVLLFDGAGNVADTKCMRVGIMPFAGVNVSRLNVILLMTTVGVMKEIRCSSTADHKLIVDWKYLYTSTNWSKRCCNGFIVSRNRIFFGFLISYARVITKITRAMMHMAMFVNTNVDIPQVLHNNHHHGIKAYWDCLEVTRIGTLVDKLDFTYNSSKFSKDYSDFPLTRLKYYYYLSRCFSYIKNTDHTDAQDTFIAHEDILCIISIKVAVVYMRNILDKPPENRSEFHLQTLYMHKEFLRQIVMSDVIIKLKLGDNFTCAVLRVLTDVRKVELRTPPNCFYCGEKLVGASCLEPHHDSRCGISMLQVIDARLKCSMCKRVFRDELLLDFPNFHCIYCDMPVRYVHHFDKLIELKNT